MDKMSLDEMLKLVRDEQPPLLSLEFNRQFHERLERSTRVWPGALPLRWATACAAGLAIGFVLFRPTLSLGPLNGNASELIQTGVNSIQNQVFKGLAENQARNILNQIL